MLHIYHVGEAEDEMFSLTSCFSAEQTESSGVRTGGQ